MVQSNPHSGPGFWRTPPGLRFQNRYWRHRERRGRRPFGVRLAWLSFGAVVMAFGVALLVLPGPGVLLLAIGGAIVAGESLLAARSLDWLEVRCRDLGGRLRRWWRARKAARVARS